MSLEALRHWQQQRDIGLGGHERALEVPGVMCAVETERMSAVLASMEPAARAALVAEVLGAEAAPVAEGAMAPLAVRLFEARGVDAVLRQVLQIADAAPGATMTLM